MSYQEVKSYTFSNLKRHDQLNVFRIIQHVWFGIYCNKQQANFKLIMLLLFFLTCLLYLVSVWIIYSDNLPTLVDPEADTTAKCTSHCGSSFYSSGFKR